MKNQAKSGAIKEIRLRWLILGQLVTWIGSSFIWPLTSVYLNKQLHVSLTVIGLVLASNCIASIVTSLLAGKCFDRFNPYPLIVIGIGLSTLTLYLLAAFHGWPAYWGWMIITGLLSGWNGTLINAIGTSLKRYSSRYVFNILYFAQNLGVVIGTIGVGYLYDFSITWLFILAASLYLMAFVNAIWHYRPISQFHRRRQAAVRQGQQHQQAVMPKINLAMILGLFTALAVTWLMYMNWESNLSVYMVSLGIPFHRYSLLWTINAAIIVLVQILLARYPHLFRRLFWQIIFGLVMFSLSFVTLMFAKDFPHFVLSMVILTAGEATAFPAIPAFVNELTPLANKGKYQGMSLVASSIGRALGPVVGGVVIDRQGYLALFIVAAMAIFLMIILLLPLYHFCRRRLTWFK